MEYSIDGFEETELGRVSDLGYGRLIGVRMVFTDKRIVRIDYRGKTAKLLRGIIGAMILWAFTSVLMITFSVLQGYTFVGTLILLPLFLIIPGKFGTKTTPSVRSIPREQVVRIEFKKPGFVTERGKFVLKLANGESLDFWSPGKPKFEEARHVMQRFCDSSPTIPFVEGRGLD